MLLWEFNLEKNIQGLRLSPAEANEKIKLWNEKANKVDKWFLEKCPMQTM